MINLENLKKLTGSPKQIKWAEDIRSKAIKANMSILAKQIPASHLDKFEKVVEYVANIQSSSFWIANNHSDLYDLIIRLINTNKNGLEIVDGNNTKTIKINSDLEIVES